MFCVHCRRRRLLPYQDESTSADVCGVATRRRRRCRTRPPPPPPPRRHANDDDDDDDASQSLRHPHQNHPAPHPLRPRPTPLATNVRPSRWAASHPARRTSSTFHNSSSSRHNSRTLHPDTLANLSSPFSRSSRYKTDTKTPRPCTPATLAFRTRRRDTQTSRALDPATCPNTSQSSLHPPCDYVPTRAHASHATQCRVWTPYHCFYIQTRRFRRTPWAGTAASRCFGSPPCASDKTDTTSANPNTQAPPTPTPSTLQFQSETSPRRCPRRRWRSVSSSLRRSLTIYSTIPGTRTRRRAVRSRRRRR
mmetsp:Transcript_7293/g.24490  ORF Transcript_7293/g.24490 Transcript_7293/m.24490 type:complete len:307 (+) Transcript_7293:253-1173(+)